MAENENKTKTKKAKKPGTTMQTIKDVAEIYHNASVGTNANIDSVQKLTHWDGFDDDDGDDSLDN
jgi:hypothetical protein